MTSRLPSQRSQCRTSSLNVRFIASDQVSRDTAWPGWISSGLGAGFSCAHASSGCASFCRFGSFGRRTTSRRHFAPGAKTPK